MSTPHDPWSAGPPTSENPESTPTSAAQDDAPDTGADQPGGTSDSASVDPNATQIRPVQERGAQVPPTEPPPWHAPASPQPSSHTPPPPGYGQPGFGQPGYGAPQPGTTHPNNQPGSNLPGYGAPQPGYPQANPQSGYGQPGYQNPGYQAPATQAPATQAPATQAPGYQNPGYQAPGYQAPGYQAPGYQAPGYQAPGYQAPGYQSAGVSSAQAPGKSKRPLIIGLCAVLVLALATVGFLVLKPSSSPAFTFAGKKIANSEAVLTAAQSTTSKLVTTRHGASNADTRCYFARATAPAKGTKKSDIDDHVYCGPVLFVDGDKAQTYLSYPISQAGTKDGAVTLTAATTPTSADPQSAPTGQTLARPDKLASKSTSNLAVPAPPPAAPGVFSTTADVSGQTIPAAPTTAVIGSRTGGVDITNLGPITRYGRGDDARSAPTGQKLIAFKTTAGPDEDGILRFPDGTITVSVAGQSHSVPRTTSTVVVAVPTSATAADLVVTDAGVTQRLSLLTGTPAATNIAVDRRLHHVGNTGGPKGVTFTISAGADKVTRTAQASLQASDLRYWVRAGDNRHASSPTTALLFVDLEYSYTEAIKAPFTAAASYGPYGFAPELLKLRLPDGRVVAAGNYSTDKDKLYILFPVPASFTSGTVVISGSESPNKNGVTLGISGSYSFAVRVAAG